MLLEVNIRFNKQEIYAAILFSFSAPMPYLIGVHSSLMEVGVFN